MVASILEPEDPFPAPSVIHDDAAGQGPDQVGHHEHQRHDRGVLSILGRGREVSDQDERQRYDSATTDTLKTSKGDSIIHIVSFYPQKIKQ